MSDRSTNAWGGKSLKFVRCKTCGCIMRWEPTRPGGTRTGVNMRNFEPGVIEGVRVRRLDGATTWRFLD